MRGVSECARCDDEGGVGRVRLQEDWPRKRRGSVGEGARLVVL